MYALMYTILYIYFCKDKQQRYNKVEKYKDGKLNTNCKKESKLNKEITISHAKNIELPVCTWLALFAVQNQQGPR